MKHAHSTFHMHMQVAGFLGTSSALPLAMAILGFNVAVLVAAAAIVAAAMASIRTLKERSSGLPPTLSLAPQKRWHLFLSHNVSCRACMCMCMCL